MTKKARIKGTDFELPPTGRVFSWASREYLETDAVDGTLLRVPIDWVEFYEPPRPEPKVGAVEIGSNGSVYVRVKGYDKDSRWLWIHPGGDTGATTWEDMQSRVMPTKPMIVIPDDQ